MIDTHAHLSSNEFANDLPVVLSRANETGIHSILAVSQDLQDARAVLALAAAHPAQVKAAVGLHPEFVASLTESRLEHALDEITTLLSTTPGIVAIGEVGLDFTPRVLASAPDPDLVKHIQKLAFKRFLSLGQRLQLPLSVHSRGAGRHALDLIIEAAKHDSIAVCMHAFDGRAIHADRALQQVPNGLYFSIPPCVVRSPQLTKLVTRVPLDRLLLESDSPVLGPDANERNEPSNIIKGLEMIAAIKGVDIEAARALINHNTAQLFPKISAATQ